MGEINHSFIIPAFGDSDYIEECIKSLINQTVKSKIILSTSTPSDFLKEISQKYSVEYVVNTRHLGISDDWNYALELCNTKYVTLAHQDDVYLSTYTEKLLLSAEKHSESLIAFSFYSEMVDDSIRKYNPNLLIKRALLFPFYLKNNLASKLLKKMVLAFGSPIPCPAVMFNKEKIADFKFSDEFHVSLDWKAWLTLADFKGSFNFIKDSLVLHRIHRNSFTTYGIKNKIRENEDLRLFSEIYPKPLAKIINLLYKLSHKSN